MIAEYVAEIFETLVASSRQDLKRIEEELNEQTPEALHTLLDKEDRTEAIQKYNSRKTKETVICPPTCSGKNKV